MNLKKLSAETLKKIRADWHMSQPKFASLLGVSVGTYRDWEQGRFRIPTNVAQQLATLSSLKKLYVHWRKFAPLIGANASQEEDANSANVGEMTDAHEQLWAKLFPLLKELNP